jgi:hypothetical protein
MPRRRATAAEQQDTQAAVEVAEVPALALYEVTRHQGAPARRAGLWWEAETPTRIALHPVQVITIERDPGYSIRLLPH